MATGKELRVKCHQTLTPCAHLQASDLHSASFAPCSKASHSVVNLLEGQGALSLQARDSAAPQSLPKLHGRREVAVFPFPFFWFFFHKTLEKLGENNLGEPLWRCNSIWPPSWARTAKCQAGDHEEKEGFRTKEAWISESRWFKVDPK